MALDTDRSAPTSRFWIGARESWQSFLSASAPLAGRVSVVAQRLVQSRIMRPITGTLLRRIFFSNLLGLIILVVGILYFSQHNAWLIEAKRESLKSQGEIIAAAIAANATVETERIVLDPDRLPEVGGALIPFRDDGFAALQLSIRPERVVPVLRRLVQPTDNRARIYARDGTLIADSAQLLTRGQIARPNQSTRRPGTKNLWTRITQYFLSADLPVYKEIGNANGNLYPEVRMAMGGAITPMLLLNGHGEQIVSVAVPIQRARSVQGVLLLSSKPGEIDEALNQERWTIFKTSLLAFGAMIAASLLLARTVAGPMRRLSEAAERVSRRISAREELPDYSQRTDEVGQMAAAFKAMTAALYRRIEASEKFAADVAHELKNPLTAARSTAESLGYARTEEQRRQLICQIQDELKRLNRLITDVSNASRLDAELALQRSEPVPLARVLQGVVGTFQDVLGDTSKSVELEIEPARSEDPLMINGHEGRMAQVITNLVDNAISFSPEGGTVLVRARRQDKYVEFCVEDDGPGVDVDKLEQIFDRFYTYRPTADSSRGTNSGLGLSISREIVHALGGTIWAENRVATGPGAKGELLGARFIVRLPHASCQQPSKTLARRAGVRS
jgi:two-component system sensor histidine kinase ChvG